MMNLQSTRFEVHNENYDQKWEKITLVYGLYTVYAVFTFGPMM